MIVTRLKLKNWRNFLRADMRFRETTYLIGANATGKSNLLDVFRFLRDVAKSPGGGLQQALSLRGGFSKVKCLHARNDPDVRIDIEISADADSPQPTWRYVLAFRADRGKKRARALISTEEVWKGKQLILRRPIEPEDVEDEERLTQTNLEQVQSNREFRELVEFFGQTTYLHLVPQLLKFSDKIGGNQIENDPFGQGFLDRIAQTTKRKRESRIRRISGALRNVVPQFSALEFVQDEATGKPHLRALYEHHRPHGAWQEEEQFSDGTLRLIALLWSLLDGQSLLLLEEPELSLNDEIVKQIPLLIHRVQRSAATKRQIVISTHSNALLSNPGIDARGVVRLAAGVEGSKIMPVTKEEEVSLKAGLSPAEVLLPKTSPPKSGQLDLLGCVT